MPVDTALAEARKTISDGPTRLEFGAPVLYMSSPDGTLFTKPTLPPGPRKKLPAARHDPHWMRWLLIAGTTLAAVATVFFGLRAWLVSGAEPDALTTTSLQPPATSVPTTAASVAAACLCGCADGTPCNVNVNFQSSEAPVPDEYLRDFGQPFGPRSEVNQGEGLVYGWVNDATDEPINWVHAARDRNLRDNQIQDTLIHMEGRPPWIDELHMVYWEIEVPKGRYRVRVGAGDAARNSRHTVLVEGVFAFDQFEDSDTQEFIEATIDVSVEDGRLSLTTIESRNTKITFVEITELVP